MTFYDVFYTPTGDDSVWKRRNVLLVFRISHAIFDYFMINSKRRLKLMPACVSSQQLSCGSSSSMGIWALVFLELGYYSDLRRDYVVVVDLSSLCRVPIVYIIHYFTLMYKFCTLFVHY